MSDELKSIYESIIAEKIEGKKRDINASTAGVLDKSHPKSPLVMDFAAELFGLSPEEIKKQPTKAAEMIKSAITYLITKTESYPALRQALRTMVKARFTEDEESEAKAKSGKVVKESTDFREFLSSLQEASKATKFNYKMLLDLEPNKLQNPFFVQLMTTFGMNENLTRPQKQGVLMFLKKLAEIADGNPQVALMLTKLVRIESIAPEAAPIAESIESQVVQMLSEASATTVAALPITLGVTNTVGALERLSGVFADLNPKMDMPWKDIVNKYGTMTFADFMKKTGISIEKLATGLVKVFPKINVNTVKNLA